MTQDEKWEEKRRQYVQFVLENGRCPSHHFYEERNMHSWYKHARKEMNAGRMRDDRREMFERVLDMVEKHRHVNQYV